MKKVVFIRFLAVASRRKMSRVSLFTISVPFEDVCVVIQNVVGSKTYGAVSTSAGISQTTVKRVSKEQAA